jgi:hypothetical protein
MSEAVSANVFSYLLKGRTYYADPLKVRRDLLQHTVGRCWGLVKEVLRLQDEIIAVRAQVDTTAMDLQTTPSTPEEISQCREIDAKLLENINPNIPFENLPRQKRLEGYETHVGALSTRMTDIEGVLATASALAFGLPPFDNETGQGTTDLEAIEVLKLFLEYAEGKGERLGS